MNGQENYTEIDMPVDNIPATWGETWAEIRETAREAFIFGTGIGFMLIATSAMVWVSMWLIK